MSFVFAHPQRSCSVKSRFLSFPSDWPHFVRNEVTGRPKGLSPPSHTEDLAFFGAVEDKLGTAELSVIGDRDGGDKPKGLLAFLFFSV